MYQLNSLYIYVFHLLNFFLLHWNPALDRRKHILPLTFRRRCRKSRSKQVIRRHLFFEQTPVIFIRLCPEFRCRLAEGGWYTWLRSIRGRRRCVTYIITLRTARNWEPDAKYPITERNSNFSSSGIDFLHPFFKLNILVDKVDSFFTDRSRGFHVFQRTDQHAFATGNPPLRQNAGGRFRRGRSSSRRR